jgi:hypothetical protein
MHLQLASKSIIFATINMTILNGLIGKTIYNDKFDYKMILSQWFATIVDLDENENEKCIHIIHN